ncbi:HCL487Cp [Eremothecium sinecaudum]|uniref:HCL487Cp n=1 Tax=Eremothecium sinecaudum TaxID=45286 RepID=A0A120K1R5_9SACH|nr:HCL487Cp [Eremothecium sinecaudum]AMD19664.1 HCL487Cp [Eremothecium sinecaudum]
MAVKKSNILHRLDNAEYQYHLVTDTLADFKPRLRSTPTLYNAKGKKSAKRLEKLIASLNIDDLKQKIQELKLELLNNKVHFVENKICGLFVKQLENQHKMLQSSKNEKQQSKLDTLNQIKDVYGFDKFAYLVVRSKIVKIVISKICPSKALKEKPPAWFAEHNILRQFNDRNDENNPSKVWNEVTKSIAGGEQLVAQLMSMKNVKELLSGLETGVDLVRGVRKAKEESERPESTEVSKKEGFNEESEDSASEATGNEASGESFGEDEEESDIDYDKLLSQCENMIVGTDEEEETQEFQLNPELNYNEVTDVEPSEDEDEQEYHDISDDDDREPLQKRRKLDETPNKLPELMMGYYSGGDDEEFEEDNVAKEQIDNKPKRKNRRGQRARQKIWEKKYGRNAKHIQTQFEKEREERARKKQEFEERAARRAARMGTQVTTTSDSTESSILHKSASTLKRETIHPSWQAKKLAEEKLKSVKFEGKKITFD